MNVKIMPQWFSYAALIVLAATVSLILYWLYSVPKEVVTVDPHPIPIITKEVKLDGFVVLEYSWCKNAKANGRVTISLVSDKSQLMLPIGYENGPKGCHDKTKVALPLPPQAVVGVYHYHFRVVYDVNPLTTRTQEFDTQDFTVTE